MLWHCWQWSCMSNLYETPAACFTGPALLSFHCPHSNISSMVIPPNLTAWPRGQSVTWAVLQLSTLATLHWNFATFFAVPVKTNSDLCIFTTHIHRQWTQPGIHLNTVAPKSSTFVSFCQNTGGFVCLLLMLHLNLFPGWCILYILTYKRYVFYQGLTSVLIHF